MEKDHFMARSTPYGGNSARDLPLTDRAPDTPMPRMEITPDENNTTHNGGCGCNCGGGTNTENGHGCCMGYEGCGEDSWGLHEYPLAMVYAPCQHFRALYDPETALSRGTLFTELDLPLGRDKDCAFTKSGNTGCRSERRKA